MNPPGHFCGMANGKYSLIYILVELHIRQCKVPLRLVVETIFARENTLRGNQYNIFAYIFKAKAYIFLSVILIKKHLEERNIFSRLQYFIYVKYE